MTAATMSYLNVPATAAPTPSLECTTPEIITNVIMWENGYNGSYNPQMSTYLQYCHADQLEAPNYAPGPAAPCSGQESSLPTFCGPMVASSPPIPACPLTPPMCSPPMVKNIKDGYCCPVLAPSPPMPTCPLTPPTSSPPMLNSVKDGFHQLVKEELKWKLETRRRNSSFQSMPTETAALTPKEEVGSTWVGHGTTNNSVMHQSLENNNNNNNTDTYNHHHNNNNINNNNCSYNSCLQSHGSPDDYHYYHSGCTLTPEDEDRRKRRRERNKIAATKCRNKKKEKTANLVQESVTLEATNVSLNKEIRQLQAEVQRLKSLLENHCCRFPVQQHSSHFMPIIYNTSCSAL